MAGPFWSIFRVSMFFVAVWCAGRTAKQMKISTILPEILTGILLGPRGVIYSAFGYSLVPMAYATCNAKVSHQCDLGYLLNPSDDAPV